MLAANIYRKQSDNTGILLELMHFLKIILAKLKEDVDTIMNFEDVTKCETCLQGSVII